MLGAVVWKQSKILYVYIYINTLLDTDSGLLFSCNGIQMAWDMVYFSSGPHAF